MSTHRLWIAAFLLLRVLALTAQGEASLSAYLIGGDSGTTEGGGFRMISAIGQPCLVGRQTGGDHHVTLGFIPAVSSEGAGGGGDDIDGDGLPNWWENLYYNSETAADPNAMASNGVNKVYDAYVAGFSPVDAHAGFWVTDSTYGINHSIGWDGVSGRVYAVYWTSNILDGFGLPLATDLPWAPEIFTDTNHPAAQQGFYKIEVELE